MCSSSVFRNVMSLLLTCMTCFRLLLKYISDYFICQRCFSDVMSAPVVCLRTVDKIRRVVKILTLDTLSHNGFPVVEDYTPESSNGVSYS